MGYANRWLARAGFALSLVCSGLIGVYAWFQGVAVVGMLGSAILVVVSYQEYQRKLNDERLAKRYEHQ